MRGWLTILSILFAVPCAADRNIDYDITLRIVGEVNCKNCQNAQQIELVISKYTSGDASMSQLSRDTLTMSSPIDLVSNYAWGGRVASDDENPAIEIVVSFEIKQCLPTKLKYQLSEIPFKDGEFVINVGKLEVCSPG